MANKIHPIQATNPTFNAYASMHQAQRSIAQRTRDLTGAVNHIVERLDTLLEKIPDRNEWPGSGPGVSGGDVDRICAAIERRDRKGLNNVIAFFAAAFSVSGDVDGSTLIGRWIDAAGGGKVNSIDDLAKIAKQTAGRQRFVVKLLETADEAGPFAASLSEQEIEDAIDLAESVAVAMKASRGDGPS